MDRAKVRKIREKLDEVLKREFPDIGVSVSGVRFSSDMVRMKLEFSETLKPGESKEAEIFKKYAHTFGFKPEDLGKPFLDRDRRFFIKGILPRSYKNPILAVDGKGKRWKFPADVVKRGLDQLKGELGVVPVVPNMPPKPSLKRSDASIIDEIKEVEWNLTPERLSEESEGNATFLRIRRNNLEGRKAELIAELGRTPTEKELA